MMRTLKAIVIGMGVMIVMAVALIGYGFYKKSAEPGWKLFGKPAVVATPVDTNTPLVSFDDINLGLIDGCKITDIRPDGRRAYVMTGPVSICDSIIVIDIKDGRIIGRIKN